MSELHRRITEQRPGWAVGDWHCQCGAFGNHSWEGFAWHLEQKLAEATAAPRVPVGELDARKPTDDAAQSLAGDRATSPGGLSNVDDSTPAPAVGELDVELLAEALQVAVGPKRIEDYRPEEFYNEYAEAIARKYVALSERRYRETPE